MKLLFTKIAVAVLVVITLSCNSATKNKIIIGSKKFTESVILGEIVRQIAISSGLEAEYKSELGGTRILWNSLLAGEIDIYPEYTGTIINEILNNKIIDKSDSLSKYLKVRGIDMTASLGFNNTYALGMIKSKAEKFNIKSIPDLKNHPEFKFGFTNEFMDREDGWRNLRTFYDLPQKQVNGLDHDLAYKALAEGSVDVIDLYSTDGEIDYYSILPLKDNRHYFTDYYALFLYRSELKKYNKFINKLKRLENSISQKDIIALNSAVKIQGKSEFEVASSFLSKKFGISVRTNNQSFWNRFKENTFNHLLLVVISLLGAIITAIPLGILSFKKKRFGKIILSGVGIIQTIPSLALLVFMIPFFGIGAEPAIAALFLYSLLPIVRSTFSGLENIDNEIIESAEVLGLSKKTILCRIELPLASRSILSGIKTSAVINVGTATLGALIGAGGFGQPILTGIRLDNIPLILEGAIPAAVLAVLVQFLFDLSENIFVPKGLRVKSDL